MHFTLKTDPLKREDLDEFVQCYHPENRHDRKATWFEEKSAANSSPHPDLSPREPLASPSRGEGD